MRSRRKKYHEQRVVCFTPQQLYAVVSDVSNYKAFVPFCVDSKVLRRIDGKTLDAELAVGFKIFTERYTSRVTIDEPRLVCARAMDSRIFSELSTSWRFSPGPREGTTNLNFDVEFKVKNPIAATAVNAFFEDVTQQQVKAFERRCKQLYGSGAAAAAVAAPAAAVPTAAAAAAAAAPDVVKLEPSSEVDAEGNLMFQVRTADSICKTVNIR
jgi:coenzyme Q-binding protein COQ10